MGGWPPPIGIEYRVDLLNAFVLLLLGLREVGAGPLALVRAACLDVMIVIIRTVESD